MPKTLIFLNGVETAQKINLELQREVSGHLQGVVPPDMFIRTYWASIDDEGKNETLKDLRNGRTRIVLCTDAFSLGVNVRDIDLVIQWDINEKLTIESLWQRIGRGSRAPERMSNSIIYVNRRLLESVPQDWEKGWKETESQVAPDDDIDLDEDLRVIPVSKRRSLAKFGIPVTRETLSKVNRHVRELYRGATSLKETQRNAKEESHGTQQERLSAAEKVDPTVLWVITNMGCTHRVFQIIFREPGDAVFTDTHQGWCCGFCAKSRGLAADTVVAPGITLGHSISYLERNPSNNKIMLPRPQAIVAPVPQPRREVVSRERKEHLQRALEEWRNLKFKELCLPPNCVLSLVLPDKVLERIVNNARNIVTYSQLLVTLREAHWDQGSSLLSEADVAGLFGKIEITLSESLLKEQANKGHRTLN